MAKYPGGTRMHGTLPVTSGERYVLTYFFQLRFDEFQNSI
jgi:hypothetical protein